MSCWAVYLPSRKPLKSDEKDMLDTAVEKWTNSFATFSCGPIHTDEQFLDEHLEHIYNSSVKRLDEV